MTRAELTEILAFVLKKFAFPWRKRKFFVDTRRFFSFDPSLHRNRHFYEIDGLVILHKVILVYSEYVDIIVYQRRACTIYCLKHNFAKYIMFFNNTTVEQPTNMTRLTQTVDIIMEPTWFVIVRLTVESFIALAGIIGNFAVCYAITKHRNLSIVPVNTYIRNVAIADLVTLLISIPLGIVREQFTYWPLGQFTCRYIFPLTDTFFGVSVWSIAAIAVERHRILAANGLRLPPRSLKIPRIVCTAIWFFSFLAISLPLLLVYDYYQPVDGKPKCSAVWPKRDFAFIYSIALSLFTYVIPLFLIFVTYYTIKRKLYRSESFFLEMADYNVSGTFKNSPVGVARSRRKRFNQIMTSVVVVFAITIFPVSLFRVVSLFYFNNPVFQKYSHVMFRICFFFYLLNAVCNPLIYSIISKRFRQSLREVLAWI